jgi:peptidoglycan/LPS O-acetylase OafA/YrhL
MYVLRAHSMPLRVAAFFALFLGLPVIFYHTVEQPMIRVGAKVAKRLSNGGSSRVSEKELELEMAP